MAKLSRSGWNNVIIFVVMGFILLINVTNKNIFSSKSQASEQFVLGANAVLLTLEINHELSIERVGRNWRATPERIAGQALTQMMRSWQQLTGQVVDAPVGADLKLALEINIAIADSPQVVHLSLLATDFELLIYNQDSQLWFSLPLELYPQLLPNAVFINTVISD